MVHLTDEAGLQEIRQSGQIVGNHGIYAVPLEVAEKPILLRVIHTGLPPSRTTQAVPIPEQALVHFRRLVPIGPYSAWKFAGKVYYVPANTLTLTTGTLSTSLPTSTMSRITLYGPDVAFYSVLVPAGIYFLNGNPEP